MMEIKKKKEGGRVGSQKRKGRRRKRFRKSQKVREQVPQKREGVGKKIGIRWRKGYRLGNWGGEGTVLGRGT